MGRKTPKEEPKRLAPTISTLKALFAKSSNRCAFPGCTSPLIDDEDEFIGQVCHIEDAMPGERFNEEMTNEQRRAIENLVLFCYPHHIKTKSVSKYSVKQLKEIKKNHEKLSEANFSINDQTLVNIFNDLKSIKADTFEILKTVKSYDKHFDELKALITQNQESLSQAISDFDREIERITKLRKSKNIISAIEQLEAIRTEKWDKLSSKEKYKILANFGISYIELNEQEKAADYLIEAYKHHQNDERAVGLAALGYTIQERHDEALSLVNKLIAKNTKEPNIYLAFIHLNRDKLTLAEVLKIVPTSLLDTTEICYSLGAFARHKDDFDNSIHWYQRALDNSSTNKVDCIIALGSTILESVTSPFHLVSGQIDNETRNKIKYSIDLFNESWEEISITDLRKSRSWLLINRGIAKKFLGDYEGAFNDIQRATTEWKSNYFSLKHLLVVSLESGKLNYAFEVIKRLESLKSLDEKEMGEMRLLKAELLTKSQAFEDAIQLVQSVIDSTIDELQREAMRLLIHIFLKQNNFERADQLSQVFVEKYPDVLMGYIDRAKLLLESGQDEMADNMLDKGQAKITTGTNRVEIMELARQLRIRKKYSQVIEVLTPITDSKIYTDLTRTLIDAYYQSGDRFKALELCKTLYAIYGPIDFVTEFQSIIYESIDDLPQAIHVCEEYLKIYPDDQLIIIRLGLVYYRIKDFDKAKEVINRLKAVDNLSIGILFQLAYFYIDTGDFLRGLEFAYNSRRNHFHKADAHTMYLGLMLQAKPPDDYSVEQMFVKVDVIVTIKDVGNGQSQSFHIVESLSQNNDMQLSINDKLAQRILGKRVGDKVDFDRNVGTLQTLEIIGIQSKYSHAFQESMDLLNNKFVDVKGFKVFTLTQPGNSMDALKPIFNSLDDREEAEKQIRIQYQKRIVPIGVLSSLRKENPIKTWSFVVGNEDYGVFSIGNFHQEIDNAQIHLNQEKGIVVDLISLMTLASRSNLSVLQNISSKRCVSRSTLEAIDELIRELDGIGSEGYITIGKVGKEYVRYETTKENIQKNKEHLNEILTWIRNHCLILPCNEALAMNAIKKAEMDKVMGKPVIDSILLAKEHNFLLIAEEESLRGVAHNEFQVKGAPSYALLKYFLSINLIDLKKFNEDVAILIAMNYKYLPVNSGVLLKCADLSNYQIKSAFKIALETLGVSVSSELSSVRVATDFFYELFRNVQIVQVRFNLTIATLQVLTKGRDSRSVISKLLALVEIKFNMLQIQKDELHSIVRDFIKTQTSLVKP